MSAQLSNFRRHLQRAISIFQGTFDAVPRIARSMYKMSEVLQALGRSEEASAKRNEAERLRRSITTFSYNPESSWEAFNALVPSFLA
jgi:hypothetical protein